MLNPHIFRAYDVRGLVGTDITPEVFRQVGGAYATLVRRRGGRRVAVGRDNRLSSPDLAGGFVAGGRAARGGGVGGGRMAEAGDVERGAGALEAKSPREDYVATLAALVHPARRLRVVVDAGNGVAGLYAPELLRRIGCEVVELHCESDGRFPHHLPDPEDERNVVDLQARVVEVGADLGVAYDGDADRVGVVDERGHRHEADLLLILLARDLLVRHPGAKVVFDVKSSQTLVDDIRAHGGVPVMWKTGHSHLKRKMREDGILLGGEVSGHMFFGERYYGVDDGLLASCKIIEIAARAPGPLSGLFAAVPHLRATPELKAPCPDAEKFRVIEELTRVTYAALRRCPFVTLPD